MNNCFNYYSCPRLKWLLLYLGQHLPHQEMFLAIVFVYCVWFDAPTFFVPILLETSLNSCSKVCLIYFSTNLIQCYCTNLQMVQLPIINIYTPQFLQHFFSSFQFFFNHCPTHCWSHSSQDRMLKVGDRVMVQWLSVLVAFEEGPSFVSSAMSGGLQHPVKPIPWAPMPTSSYCVYMNAHTYT